MSTRTVIIGQKRDGERKEALVSDGGAIVITSEGAPVSASITRPSDAAAYTAGDVIETTAASYLIFEDVLETAGAPFLIMGALLRIDTGTIPAGMSAFRLHLYDAAPTAVADNAVFNLPVADRTQYIGYIDFIEIVDLGDTLIAQATNVNLVGKLVEGSTDLYGLLQTVGAYTPASGTVYTVSLNVVNM